MRALPKVFQNMPNYVVDELVLTCRRPPPINARFARTPKSLPETNANNTKLGWCEGSVHVKRRVLVASALKLGC